MYCLDVKAIVSIGMIMIWFGLVLMFLLDRRLYDKSRRIHYLSLAALIFWCLFALVFGGFVEKGYAGITLISMTVIEVLVRRKEEAGAAGAA